MDGRITTISTWLGEGSINIFGLPFAGKDTQGRKLADLFNGVLISGGDILRCYRDQSVINQVMASGGLIPSDLFMKIALPYLSRSEFGGKPLILSSIGRMHGEESITIKTAQRAHHPIKLAILLTITEKVVWQRFETVKHLRDRGQRNDDNRTALQTRLDEFEAKTKPVIEFYRSNNLLIEIDGEPTRGEVTNQILDSLVRLSQQ